MYKAILCIAVNCGFNNLEYFFNIFQMQQFYLGMRKIWTDRGITKATKKRLVYFPIATYGCESWTLIKADQSRITSFEMWCWQRMLRISWYMKRSNISILEEIQPKRRLLSHVQSQMMKYFGHIARRGGNSLEKVIMQGCVGRWEKEAWKT